MSFATQFSYAKQGILNFLHIVILVLSLFLLVSISWDTFNNVSFLNQPSRKTGNITSRPISCFCSFPSRI